MSRRRVARTMPNALRVVLSALDDFAAKAPAGSESRKRAQREADDVRDMLNEEYLRDKDRAE